MTIIAAQPGWWFVSKNDPPTRAPMAIIAWDISDGENEDGGVTAWTPFGWVDYEPQELRYQPSPDTRWEPRWG